MFGSITNANDRFALAVGSVGEWIGGNDSTASVMVVIGRGENTSTITSS